ncbi:hypothetical protein FNV40_12045 [Enterococcus durans]|nr:hypothetical protein FNV40_12045 [Enterococcus durans]
MECYSHENGETNNEIKLKPRQKSLRFEKLKRKTRLGQKCLTPRNKKKFTEIAFQIFVDFGLFPKELLLLPPFIRF